MDPALGGHVYWGSASASASLDSHSAPIGPNLSLGLLLGRGSTPNPRPSSKAESRCLPLGLLQGRGSPVHPSASSWAEARHLTFGLLQGRKLRSCQNCGEMISEFVLFDLQSSVDIENLKVPSLPKLASDAIQGGSNENLASTRQNTYVSPATESKSPVSGGTISWLRKCTSKILKISPIRKIESEDAGTLRDIGISSVETTNVEDSPGRIPGIENEAELSFAVVNDSLDVLRVEVDRDPSVDNRSNVDSKAPEDIQPPDSKVGQQKPRKEGGRTRVKRTNTVKAVLKEARGILGEDAEALPGESVDDHETEFPNGMAEDSANVNSESQKPSNRRIPVNVRKRNRVQTSQMTVSGHDDNASEGHSDSLIPGQRKRRRQKAAAPLHKLLVKKDII
ncbi:hypothetical protein Fmac_017293 [Flemingia macrophylla]|uniref:Uncharacterized protein n=1 Tax=Flemingia macrophylla TaxID=520843 RepID=A0ABD1M1P4_9FABA